MSSRTMVPSVSKDNSQPYEATYEPTPPIPCVLAPVSQILSLRCIQRRLKALTLHLELDASKSTIPALRWGQLGFSLEERALVRTCLLG